MIATIVPTLKQELNRVHDTSHVETEARLGHFNIKGEFMPGVKEDYFNSMKKILSKFAYAKQRESIAIYFTDGLRSEVFQNGKIESMRKRKITNDIDLNIKEHYSLRISTSKEEPYINDVLDTQVKKFLKPKQVPRLLREGTLMKLAPGSQVQYNGKMYKVEGGFADLTWRVAMPDVYIRLDRERIKTMTTKYTANDWIDMISLAGIFRGRPSYMAQFSVKAHIRALTPLTQFANVIPTPPYIPTAWRSKKRVSYQLWNGLNIDMTETVYSKQSIQHCYDGRGRKTYEVEADWDLSEKTVKDFAEVVKHVLYSKS
jgi:hypothetical protein